MSDIDTVVADSLKALDPEWPIREADIAQAASNHALVEEASRAVTITRSPVIVCRFWNFQQSATINTDHKPSGAGRRCSTAVCF